MTNWILFLTAALFASIALRLWYRRWRRIRIARRRRVEKPNSYYVSQGVQNQLDRHRWEGIRKLRLHPVNREEVDRLLGLVDAVGVHALTPGERQFLDNMARPIQGEGGRTDPSTHSSPTPPVSAGESDPVPDCG